MNRWRRVAHLVLVAVVALLVLGTAAPASAHATLVASDPAEGAVLESAPERIGLTFDEAVAGVPDGVQVFDAEGESVASSSSVSGKELAVELGEDVGDGTLVVVWRVLSEDGHPISGSLSFSVGAPSARVTPPAQTTATDAPWTLGAARVVGYVGLLLTAGLTVFTLLLLTPAVPAAARRRPARVARLGAVAAALGWLTGLPLTVAYQVGGGLDSLSRSATWSALPPTEYGVTAAVVLGSVVAVVLLGHGAPGRGRGRAALGAGAVALAGPALTGHTRAASPEALAVAADALHLVAGSVWLGGLVGLALVLPGLTGRDAAGGEVLARFSGVAAGVLAALTVTGVLLAWRIVGAWRPLVDTDYGLLLLGKVALVLVAVAIAAWNRFALLPRLQRAVKRRDRDSGSRLVARSTFAEAGVLLAVLLVTGVLVDESPEPEAAAASAADPTRGGPQVAPLDDVTVEAELSPQAVGPTTLTLRLRDSTGAPAVFYEPPRARLFSEQVDLGTVPLTSTVAGTHTAQLVLPSPGTWRLQVSLRTGEFDNPVTYLEFVVGEP
ncbi:CopD family protein [Nocardioides sp. 503]|uniref:copper resistance CopC/CopD family protein n=1 Tax=Nocardioides sp. 503 TaxID=2508326 RepID=UPI001FD721AF|nr:CopD family protein [Nocardioides sp. 503]